MSMKVIEHIEVGSGGAASITFSAIPADYTDLYLVCSLRSATSSSETSLYPNGSTSNLSGTFLRGTGSNRDAAPLFRWYSSHSAQTASTFANLTAYFPNYAGSTAKSYSADSVNENNATSAIQTINAGLWNDTTPISSLTIDISGSNFEQYSSATLFGITAGSDGSTTVS